MIPCRVTQAPFCALLSGSRDRISEPTNFDLVTIGGGFADHALRCSKQHDASYLMLTCWAASPSSSDGTRAAELRGCSA